MSIAYVLVAVTYLGIGAVFYLTFPLQKDCIEDVRTLEYILVSFNLFFKKFISFSEFVEQFFAIGHVDCHCSCISPLSNADRLSPPELYSTYATALRLLQFNLS